MGGRNEQQMMRGTCNQNAWNQSLSLSQLRTGRRIAASSSITTPISSLVGTNAAIECDSNADTCVLGKNFVVLAMTYRTADVYPYDNKYKPITNVPIVTGATAWDDPTTAQTYILVFNKSLYYGPKLDHSLVNPN